jgi:hypothetical protein
MHCAGCGRANPMGAPFFDREAVIRFLDDEPNVPLEQRAFCYPTWVTVLSIRVLHERYGL